MLSALSVAEFCRTEAARLAAIKRLRASWRCFSVLSSERSLARGGWPFGGFFGTGGGSLLSWTGTTNSQLAAAAGGETGAETAIWHTCTQTALRPAAANATEERERLRGRLRAVRERGPAGVRGWGPAPPWCVPDGMTSENSSLSNKQTKQTWRGCQEIKNDREKRSQSCTLDQQNNSSTIQKAHGGKATLLGISFVLLRFDELSFGYFSNIWQFGCKSTPLNAEDYGSNRSCKWMKKDTGPLVLMKVTPTASSYHKAKAILQVCYTFLSGGSRGLQLLALSWCSSSNFRLMFSMESWSISQNPARSWATGRGWAFRFCWAKIGKRDKTRAQEGRIILIVDIFVRSEGLDRYKPFVILFWNNWVLIKTVYKPLCKDQL